MTDPKTTECWCYRCEQEAIAAAPPRDLPYLGPVRFIVCPDCGNKRCPRATDHRLACTRSNATGQKGSRYE